MNIATALNGMKLSGHIVVGYRDRDGFHSIGGSFSTENIIKRFGHMEICKSWYNGTALRISVQPVCAKYKSCGDCPNFDERMVFSANCYE